VSEPPEIQGDEHEEIQGDEHEDEAIRKLVKRALAIDPNAPVPSLLPGVQRRIRRRSRGRFFADRWSTTQTRASYLLVGLLTLLVAAIAYFALGSLGLW
jgi:hypothetical protein